MRDIRPPNVQETLTPFEGLSVGGNLLLGFPISGIYVHPGTSTPTEYFLVDPPSALSHNDMHAANLSVVPNDILANRFALLFNTYWHASINTALLVGRPLNYSLNTLTNPWANTTASLSSFTPAIYVVNKGWLVVLVTATAVLFLTSIVGLVIKYRTHAPDIFGYVSSLLRDSPYLAVPGIAHGSFLTGTQYAQLVKDVHVRFLHVNPDSDMGRISLALWQDMNKGRQSEGKEG
jgi:hypothetical protein